MAWRLHVPAAVHDLEARARASKLPLAERRRAMDALAFIDAPAASDAMLKLAGDKGPLSELATWWLLNRLSNSWADHNLRAAMKVTGIYDPDAIALEEVVAPRQPADTAALSIDDIVNLPGNAARGQEVATRCLVCHAIGGTGADVGPALDGWARGKSAAVIARAIVQPSAEIAEGFAGTELRTSDGLRIQGIVIKEGDPLMVRSRGGLTQIVPAKRVASRSRMTESLMFTPAQLGLTAQNVADLIAFLRTR
jgi:putative heme-binding domain-containing protein